MSDSRLAILNVFHHNYSGSVPWKFKTVLLLNLAFMKGKKLKQLLDPIPLIILTIYALQLTWLVISGEINFLWKHILGLVLLPIVYYLFYRNHKLGVLGLGTIIIIGLFGLLSYSSEILISTLYWSPSGNNILIFYGQPIFVLWLTLHLILSFRYYIGIGTGKYWQNFNDIYKIGN